VARAAAEVDQRAGLDEAGVELGDAVGDADVAVAAVTILSGGRRRCRRRDRARAGCVAGN